jgi:CRP/FNR family transcriptional regulator, cyclic AMP receptor protein
MPPATSAGPRSRTRHRDGQMRRATTNSHVRLLDLDPALRAGLSGGALDLARELVVAPVQPLDKGAWRPSRPSRPGRHLGFLLIEGVLFRRIQVAGREGAELLGPGDLLRPWQPPRSWEAGMPASWTVVEAGALAVLDERVTGAIGRWPELVAAVVGRAVERPRALAVTLGIGQMPGAELRVLALLWHLAERFGHRDGDGWVVPIQLTHQMLGGLVRTQRPTVSSALAKLAQEGLIARRDDGWWAVRGDPPERLEALRRAVRA